MAMAMAEAPAPMMGKFPVVLSDALMGRSSKEVFTGIKYLNPPPPAESTTSATLKPSTSDLSKFNLTLSSPTTTSYYHGSRADGKRRGQGKYVLVFDDARQAFVLHQLDSEFEMAFVRADDESRSKPAAPTAAAAPAKGGRKKATAAPPRKEDKPKPDTLPPPKRQKMAAPAPAPARKRKEHTPEIESEEDSDDGLTIEYPGGKPPARGKGVSRLPPPPPQQPPPAEVGGYRPRSPDLSFGGAAERDDSGGYGGDGQESEEEGEEGEGEGDGDIEHFDLGSPVGHGNARHESGSEEDDDGELDLEAELERELAKGGESSESEEE